MPGPLILISNPKCGDGAGHAFVQKHVIPFLADHDVSVDRAVVTDAPGHAGVEVLKFINEHLEHASVSLVVSGGDGTLHEIINEVYAAAHQFVQRPIELLIALIPKPSESSAIEYKLRSLRSLVGEHPTTVPLSIAKTIIQSADSRETTLSVFSGIVTSTSLHASILDQSEKLRKEIPDISRFKVAAQNNIARWYHSNVLLRPTKEGLVSIYDNSSGSFVPYSGDNNDPSRPTMYGPFSYFLSTVNVDRLEPSFVIAPLHSTASPDTDSMDIVIVRPRRDPTVLSDTDDDHARFAEKTISMLGAAYRKGSHVKLRYTGDGTVNEESKPIHSFVEYVRCGGWEWAPEEFDDDAHLLCADGTMFRVRSGVYTIYWTTSYLLLASATFPTFVKYSMTGIV
ncbi:hypothetical protein EW145_g1060 [Phellinidium pouzarii]|uniref:DAGKc domain-containing protein n=1 Tax=Phellinidium pouzarii TaxID=167371 RepID=A0A4S4LG01_9AGAM|nr:hypothetical protein EW145_g1060 [Phellinidium pouzarii]